MTVIVDWAGASGQSYRYWALADTTRAGIQAVAGNYVFAKEVTPNQFQPLYFGQADDLQARIPTHERMRDAIKLGATHVMAHSTQGGLEARCDEERDLIARWNPPMNVQHRVAS